METDHRIGHRVRITRFGPRALLALDAGCSQIQAPRPSIVFPLIRLTGQNKPSTPPPPPSACPRVAAGQPAGLGWGVGEAEGRQRGGAAEGGQRMGSGGPVPGPRSRS